jgi:hypothetical protein
VTVEVAWTICETILLVTYLKVYHSILLWTRGSLSKGNEIEDVFSLRDKIIKCEIGSGSDIEAIVEFVLWRIDRNNITLILQVSSVSLREVI